MGKLCIIGVDDHRILKDFIRAHVEHLEGDKVCIDHWYPDYKHEGRTIRYFHSMHPVQSKAKKLLPQFLYHRLVIRNELSERAVHDAIAGFFRDHQVDVILAEFGTTGADIWKHAHDLGIPLIVHFHGHDAHRTSVVDPCRERYKAMFKHAFRIISVSNYMTQALIELGADPARVVYNPYGPRPVFYENHADYSKTVLSLGRFTDIKANHLTLMAFREALKRVPDARMVMAGDGKLLETCRSLAQAWGIADKVSFPGAIPHSDVLPLFADACCFVQHSVVPSYGDAEGTPVAILEAQAAGLPVVSTRHAGITDAVVHGETGFLVEERDVEGMAEYLSILLADRELCMKMGAQAREHVRLNYNIERHISCIQKLVDAARAS